MARGDLLKQMLLSYSEGNDDGFRAAASQVIDAERRKHHVLLADELESIIGDRTANRSDPSSMASIRPLPRSKEDADLIRLINPRRTLERQILTSETERAVLDVAEEHQQAATLRASGLYPARKVLFVGPPGTGKTSTAEALASELGLPLAQVNLAAVVSSLLGETSRNLSAIFDAARSESWVVLFDEFDSLGRERSDRSEHGELKRVVNTFLQLLDAFRGASVIVAATNHPSMLDDAVWRRFDVVVGFDYPTRGQVEQLIRKLFRKVSVDLSPRRSSEILTGLSQADIESVCMDAMKRLVLRGGEAVTEQDLRKALKRWEAARTTIRRFQE